jgi:Lrp/AsnC family leucine-responsive transcriptional regulator
MAEKTREEKAVIYGEKYPLDEKDKKILTALYEDGRMMVAKIAKKTGLQRDSIIYRIKKMLDNKVILYFRPVLNPPKIGFPTMVSVVIRLENLKPEMEKKFIDFISNHKNISYFARVSGRWDYWITIEARDPGHFDDILKEIRSKFPNNVKEFESFTLIQEYKYDWMLDLVHA